jgi:hypothetical protein
MLTNKPADVVTPPTGLLLGILVIMGAASREESNKM